jgi:trans-2,3-dihydro-3-hydroxyanthranilate isomerase
MPMMNRREFGLTGISSLTSLALTMKTAAAAQTTGGRAYRYVHLDVFTDRRLAGNQLLVFVQPAGLDADAMQALTRESNYSECTFVFPPEQAGTDHRVRIFGRTAEMPFAGHPTIGTVFALVHAGVLKPGMMKTTFGLGVGPTNIDLEWKGSQLAFAWMTQLKPTFGKTIDDPGVVAAAIGLDKDAVVRLKPDATDRAATIPTGGVRLQPDPVPAAQEVNCGSTFLIVPLATRKAVDAAVLDRAKVDAMLAAAGIQRRGIYVFSTEKGQDDATAYSRLLGTGGIEDPATGSAAGPAGCFAVKHRLVPPAGAGSIVFLQGVQVRRPSRIHVRVAVAGDDISGVKVGGASVVVGEGTMTV